MVDTGSEQRDDWDDGRAGGPRMGRRPADMENLQEAGTAVAGRDEVRGKVHLRTAPGIAPDGKGGSSSGAVQPGMVVVCRRGEQALGLPGAEMLQPSSNRGRREAEASSRQTQTSKALHGTDGGELSAPQ